MRRRVERALGKMATRDRLSWILVLLTVLALGAATAGAVDDGMRTYIVQMSKLEKPSAFATHRSWYYSTFSAVRGGIAATTDSAPAPQEHPEGILHTYDTVFWGFAARLTDAEVRTLESKPGILRVHPEGVRHLHTSHTTKFLGLKSSGGLLAESEYGEDVIIGVIDTGIWPEIRSFSDEKVGDIPSRWKGSCVQEPTFNSSICSKKLIGAKYYLNGYEASRGPINESLESRSPRDDEGHGTHTSSTAGGGFVEGANLLGFANGTARGMAPKARIAVYKVCWAPGCYDSDILAAFDNAVADGVDVISLSVGGGVIPYYADSIAIGAYGAMKKGVVVSCSAGNSGPGPFTAANVAPWMITVAASTVDRKFPAVVTLGNGKTFEGTSLYSGPGLGDTLLPLVYGGNATKDGYSPKDAAQCVEGSLDPDLVNGRIVLCDRGNNARVAKGGACHDAGAVGAILRNLAVDGEGLLADAHVLPVTAVGAKAGAEIFEYAVDTTDKAVLPQALIKFGGTVLGVKPAPVVASFSSRGPNSETPQILKPDITGPGVNILAGWTSAVGPTGLETDDRRVEFNIISGTSMSCPHISGVAALLRGAQPSWSPAAIKSAMMTTAYVIDSSGNIITDEATGKTSGPLGYGAGHVVPEKALNPGLIYDLEPDDYVKFFCSLNYPESTIQLLDPDISSCPNTTFSDGAVYDLNYPSFSAVFGKSNDSKVSFNRTVTNVGPAESNYTVSWEAPKGVTISIEPEVLQFSEDSKKLSYSVDVVVEMAPAGYVEGAAYVEPTYGSLTWTDGTYVVRSPILINWTGSESEKAISLLQPAEELALAGSDDGRNGHAMW